MDARAGFDHPKGRRRHATGDRSNRGCAFRAAALSEEECDQLTWLLTMPREAAGDF
jgi:hypothetical protein